MSREPACYALWTPQDRPSVAPIRIQLHPKLDGYQDALMQRGVYIIHASHPYFHAQHYTGYGPLGILRRVAEHLLREADCPLTEAMLDAGCELSIARAWLDRGQYFERALKLRAHTRDFCTYCNPTGWQNYEVHPRPDQLLGRQEYAGIRDLVVAQMERLEAAGTPLSLHPDFGELAPEMVLPRLTPTRK